MVLTPPWGLLALHDCCECPEAPSSEEEATKGCRSSSSAVGRRLGSKDRQRSTKSRASGERCSGMLGSSLFLRRNTNANCTHPHRKAATYRQPVDK